MNARWQFAGIGLAAVVAGTALWLANRAGTPPPAPGPVGIAPPALYAAAFVDASGRARSLGEYQGKLVVLNFWATWCGPCLEEMPAFTRLQGRWAGRGVQFVGLSGEAPEPVERFGRKLGINYPLWTGGDGVGELSRRLGNRIGVLPHTALIGPAGEVLETKVGPYSESELEQRLEAFAPKSS